MLLGVDVGGTFTDAVLAVDGAIFTAKAPTTPGDQSHGVIAAVEEVLGLAGARADDVELFSHGMTVATNALLEGRGARTAFVATDGFADLVALGRQNRPELYRLCAAPAAPITPPERRFGARERMTPAGVLRPLEDVDKLVRAVAACEPEAVAVALLHSYRHPEHERELGAALESALPEVHVSLSHEVVGTFREFERAATTEVDAALSPLLGGYLRRLRGRCAERGLPEPAIMQSNGGLIDIDAAAEHAAWTVLSGPAGGAAGAAFVARASGEPDALCFDMGGTSCDVCAIDGGVVRETDQRTIAGRPLALPSLDIETVGAGGGSIGWRDAGGALRVGPRSAGATPGPAAYGRGGTEATVTDAHLVLGHLSRDGRLAGGVRLAPELALAAVSRLAAELAIDPLRAAQGIVDVANAEMLGALRSVTVARGIDPRRYVLLPFGGAGPLHATAIAAQLGITRILCPRACGVLSALGLAVAAPRRDATASFEAAQVGPLLERARAALGAQAASERVRYALRYRGQSFELSIDARANATRSELRERFEAAHEQLYGYREDAAEVELVTVTASVWGEQPALEPRAGREPPRRTTQRMWHEGQGLEAGLIVGEPEPGERIDGPAICALPEATLLVTPGWRAVVAADGTIELSAA